MDTIQLIAEISILKEKMDNAEAFLEELIEYLLVTCKDDDYITPEVICRKLAKYGYIELENGYWVNPMADRKTEPQIRCPKCGRTDYIKNLEKDFGVKDDIFKYKCINCNTYIKDEPTTEDCSTVSTCSKMEQVEDEPQTYVINPQEPTNDDKCFECDDFFTCGGQCNKIEDEPNSSEKPNNSTVSKMEQVEEPTEITYQNCSDALLKMWMDNVLTDAEYNRIMDKLNNAQRKDEPQTERSE